MLGQEDTMLLSDRFPLSVLAGFIRRQGRGFFLVLFLLCGLSHPGHAAGPIELSLQVAGDFPVPGIPGMVFYRIGDAVSNGRGDILFIATFGPVDPESEVEPSYGVFLKNAEGIHAVAVRGDPIGLGFQFHASQSGSSTSLAGLEMDLNESGTVALILADSGVMLWQDGTFRWLSWLGYVAPGSAGAFVEFGRLSDLWPNDSSRPFLSEQNEVVFRARLNNGSTGIFLASAGGVATLAHSGDPVPGRDAVSFSNRFSSPYFEGSSAWFAAFDSTRQIEAIYRYSGPNLVSSVQVGDVLTGLDVVSRIREWDPNADGQLSVVVESGSVESVVILDDVSTRVIARNDQLPPGYGGTQAFGFSNLSLNDAPAAFFVAHDLMDYAALYLWRENVLTRIVADGDARPAGGTFVLGWESPFTPGPIGRQFSTTELTDTFSVGFNAESGYYLWQDGEVEPFPGPGPAPGLPGSWLEGLGPLGFNPDGSLLLSASICCHSFGSALYLTRPPIPQWNYLPLFAVGQAGRFRYSSTLVLANHSRYEGSVLVEFFDRNGNLLLTDREEMGSGEIADIDLSPDLFPELSTGYARVEVRGGARVSGEAIISLFESSDLVSRTTVSLRPPDVFSASILAEVGSGTDTGVALTRLTSGSQPGLRVHLDDPTTGTSRTTTLELSPASQQSIFVSELFDGLPNPFLGVLTIEGRQPFLATGLRMSGLKLSTIPVEPGPSPARAWSFEYLLPDQFPAETVPGPAGRIAVQQDSRGRVELIEENETLPVLVPNVSLPETGSPMTDLGIVGFLAGGDLVVSARTGGDDWVGVYRVHERVLEELAQSDQPLAEGGIFFGQAVVNPEGLLLLETDTGGGSLFYLYDGQVLQPWIRLNEPVDSKQLDFRRNRGIGYRSADEIGFIDPSGSVTTIARLHDLVRPGFEIRIFHWVRMLSDGRVVFMANDASQARNALCVNAKGGFRVLTASGTEIPGSQARVAGFSAERPSSTIRVNGRDEIMLKSRVTVGGSAEQLPAFLRFSSSGSMELISPIAENPTDREDITSVPEGRFVWTDQGELYFKAISGRQSHFRRANLYRWQNGSIETVLGEGRQVLPDRAPGTGLVEHLGDIVGGDNQGVLFVIRVVGDAATGLYRAVSGDRSRQWIPRVAVGDFGPVNYRSTLLIHNPGETPTLSDVRLSGIGDAGAVEPVEITPGEVKRLTYDSSGVFVGWASVDSQGSPVRVHERLAVRIGGVLRSEVTVPAVRPLREGYWVGEIDPELGVDSGLAVVNPERAQSDLSVELLSPGFVVEDVAEIPLQAAASRAILLSELFPSLPPGKHLLRIRSGLPVSALVLRLQGTDITASPILGVDRFYGATGVVVIITPASATVP